eukprot:9482251-Pyramimonas_sp.AAC.1
MPSLPALRIRTTPRHTHIHSNSGPIFCIVPSHSSPSPRHNLKASSRCAQHPVLACLPLQAYSNPSSFPRHTFAAHRDLSHVLLSCRLISARQLNGRGTRKQRQHVRMPVEVRAELGALAAAGAPAVSAVGLVLWDRAWGGSAFALNLFKCALASSCFIIFALAAEGPAALAQKYAWAPQSKSQNSC